MTTNNNRSIIIYRRGEQPLIVENIPSTAKITFGAVQPGKREYGGGSENALRIYTAASNQLGVFLNVTSFRDLSLTVKERKVTTKASSEAEVGPDGVKRESATEETYEWTSVSDTLG